MAPFWGKKKSYVGVDLGGGGIKVVELLSEKGRARLFTYGFTEKLAESESVSLVDSPKESGELLKKIFQKAQISNFKAVAGLPIASVFSSVITVPKAGEKELQEAIRYQAQKLIPMSLDEMVLDFRPIAVPAAPVAAAPKPAVPADASAAPAAAGVVPTKKEDPKTVQVLITGASKTMVQKYVTLFKAAGIELDSLETEAFGLIRSLVGKDRATTMIVDMGAVRTNIIIVENGIPYVTRSLDMGGLALTKAMSKALAIDLAQAEHMKCDIKSVQTLYPGEGLPKVFETAVSPLLTELRYSMNLYAGQSEMHAGTTIEKVILTGGSAALPSLAQHFGRELGIKTYLGDPWARVAYPDDLRPALEEIGPRFAVCVGLSMRDMD
jgi:type IV pilus assembly protein PilM